MSDNALELKASSAAFVDERLEVRLSPPFGLRFETRHLRHVGVLVRQHHSQRGYPAPVSRASSSPMASARSEYSEPSIGTSSDLNMQGLLQSTRVQSPARTAER